MIAMKLLFTILIVFISLSMKAQTNIEVLQNEIDKTVWTQFKASFETINSETLNSIYADDVLRVTPDGIDTQNSFKINNAERFKMLKEKSGIIKLAFWFESRQTNLDTSYEVGYFRMATTLEKETSVYYGQFHIVLKKIDGNWKISQDWDTNTINGQIIGQEEFERNGQNKLY